MADKRYGFLYGKLQESTVKDKLEAYKLLRTPMLYVHQTYHDYELLMDGIIREGGIVDTSDYDIFWEVIYKLWKDDSFFQNQTYKNYGVSKVTKDPDHIGFTWMNTEWHIFLTFDRLKREYPVDPKFLVWFDEDQVVKQEEIYGTLMFFVQKLGKDNDFDNVYRYPYQDAVRTQNFYVFYKGNPPTHDRAKLVIREDLVIKFGYEEAKKKYPNLFVDSYRNVYPHYANEAYSIDYDMLRMFVVQYGIFHPEIIMLLDWMCPIVIENGIDDVLPDFHPQVGKNPENDKFIYFLTKVLNYLEGRVLDAVFIREAQFTETDEYAAFIFRGIEWRVKKISKLTA